MDDSERTIFCGNLSSKVTEEILYELFLQVAPVEKVKIPRDKDGRQSGFAFVTFKHIVSVPYAMHLLNGIALYHRKIVLRPRNNSQQNTVQENNNHILKGTMKSNSLKDMVLGGSLQFSNIAKRHDMSPQSRRERNYNHNHDRRNDKPYGQVYRNRNNRHDYDSRTVYSGSYYRRQQH